MAKVTLNDLTTNFGSQALHNANNDTIEDNLNNKVLYRDNPTGEPNQMENELDMNSNKIINLEDGVNGKDAVNVNQLNALIAGSGSVSSIVQARESQLGSQAVSRVFTFTGITYAIGVNTLSVYRNGQRLEKTEDYTETSTSSITLTFDPNDGDRFVFVTNDLSTSEVTDTAAITHTESGTNYNLATYLQNRHVINVKDYGAVGDGVTDDTIAINSAITAATAHDVVFFPAGTYSISSGLVCGDHITLQGAGRFATYIQLDADTNDQDVITLNGSTSVIRALQINKVGSHTKSGVYVNNGRCVLEELYITGMGGDGIHVYNGNLGSMRDIISLSNGQDGIHFGDDTANSNSYKLEGIIDVRGNTRDGLHIEGTGTSNDSVTHNIQVIAQQNGRYGVYINSRSNVLTIYSEANTSNEVYLDTNAEGNRLTMMEGTDVSDNGSFNLVETYSMSADNKRGLKSKLELSGSVGAGLRINADDGTTGELTLEKTGANAFELECAGSSSNMTLTIKHNNSSYKLNTVADKINATFYSTPVTFVDGDTTPSVAESNKFIASNTGATSITGLDDIENGQSVTILFTNSNTTIVNSGTLQLAGGANFVGANNSILELVRIGSNIYEVSRSVN